LHSQSSSEGVAEADNADAVEEAVVAAAAAEELHVDDGAVALVGAAVVVADAPKNPAVAEDMDSPEAVVDGEDVKVEHCVLAPTCTEEVDSHTGDVDRRRSPCADGPARGGDLALAGLDERPLAAGASTGDSEE
jgi:hypothetical protein